MCTHAHSSVRITLVFEFLQKEDELKIIVGSSGANGGRRGWCHNYYSSPGYIFLTTLTFEKTYFDKLAYKSFRHVHDRNNFYSKYDYFFNAFDVSICDDSSPKKRNISESFSCFILFLPQEK